MALPPDILRTIKDLERRVTNLETTPQPPNIRLTGLASATFDLLANSHNTITITLTDEQDKRLLAQPNVSIFRSSAADDDALFPFGSDWSYQDGLNIGLHTWLDWGTTDNNNVVVRVMLVNTSATNYTDLYIAANLRYLSRGATS